MPFLTSLPLPQPKLPGGPLAERRAWPRRRILLWALMLLSVVLVLVLLRTLSMERRVINTMEPQARAALFKETWESFQTLCRPQVDPALASRCREEALFLLKFPECDESCRRQLDIFTRPTR